MVNSDAISSLYYSKDNAVNDMTTASIFISGNKSQIRSKLGLSRCIKVIVLFVYGLTSSLLFAKETTANDLLSTYVNENAILVSEIIRPTSDDIDGADIYLTISQNEETWALMASMLINMDISTFISTLNLAPTDCTWLHKCRTVVLLASPSENERMIATVLNTPWPLDDRLMLTASHVQYNEKGTSVKVIISALEHDPYYRELFNSLFLENNKDFVIIDKPRGEWILKKQAKNTYKLTYIASASKNTKIPNFMRINHIKKSTIATFRNLEDMEQNDTHIH
jgi:hypothetical protein